MASGQVQLAYPAALTHIFTMTPRDRPSASTEAYGRALEALREPLLSYFRRRVHEQHEAVDLVQEVYLRLSTRGGGEQLEQLRSYVFQVAASVLADRHRRRAVRHADAHVELDPDRGAGTAIGPDRIVAGRQALRAALAVLSTMPERTRTIFVLRRMEGMRYREIATKLGISVSAVEKHMIRAIDHLAAMENPT